MTTCHLTVIFPWLAGKPQEKPC